MAKGEQILLLLLLLLGGLNFMVNITLAVIFTPSYKRLPILWGLVTKVLGLSDAVLEPPFIGTLLEIVLGVLIYIVLLHPVLSFPSDMFISSSIVFCVITIGLLDVALVAVILFASIMLRLSDGVTHAITIGILLFGAKKLFETPAKMNPETARFGPYR